MNHLATIWLSPRATLRDLLDTKPGKLFFPLAAVYGMANGLNLVKWHYVQPPDGSTVMGVLQVTVLFGAVLGIATLFVFSYLVAGIGRWLGGTTSPRAARTILAWASIPYALPLLIIVPFFLAGDPVFTYRVGGTAYRIGIVTYYLAYFVALFWTIRILDDGYSESFGVSKWKVLVLSLLSVVVMGLALMGVFNLLATIDVLWL